jgi:flagellar biosynthesis GTPase FlhF
MFFVEMCLKNPEIPSKQIYKGILDERLKQGGNIDYFKKIIRGYTCFINNKMAKYFTEILGYEATSEKLHSYHKEKDTTGVNPPEMNIFLYKLNYLINKEAYPNHPEDITGNKILKDTLKKYTSFKKTIRKNTSSSDLSSKERESRRNRIQLKKDYHTKLLEFIDRKTAKDKERKATEKIRKAEEKERKATEKIRKAEEKATEQLRKAEEKKRKATEQAEEKERKVTEKLRKAEEVFLSKTAKSRPKTTKSKTLKMTTSVQKSSPTKEEP